MDAPSLNRGPVAALDCGTNSTRILIVDGEGRTLDRQMRITRLGQGVDASHKLAPEAMDRTLSVLAHYRQLMEHQATQRARLVATSAVRDAVNGEEFLDAAGQTVGVQAELLAGHEEGTLAYRGAIAGLTSIDGPDVVVDIGGGSTELVVENGGAIEAISLDLGCVRLTERHLHHDVPLTSEIASAQRMIDAELERAVDRCSTLTTLGPVKRLLGLAGTVSTLCALEIGLDHYDFEALHHATLSREAVERWCDVLVREPAASRRVRVGMTEGREDVIVGGALVLRTVMSRFGFESLTVSETDILDGLAFSQLNG